MLTRLPKTLLQRCLQFTVQEDIARFLGVAKSTNHACADGQINTTTSANSNKKPKVADSKVNAVMLSWGDIRLASVLKAVKHNIRRDYTQNPSRVQTLGGHTSDIRDFVVTPGGYKIISCSADKTIKIWDLLAGTCLRTIACDAFRVAVTPDAKQIISGSSDGTISVWESETGKRLNNFKARTELPGFERSIQIEEHCGGTLAVTPDGSRVVSRGWADSDIRVWDLKTGQCLKTLKNSGSFGFAFTPDGSQIISGGSKTVKVLDLATGISLKKFNGHTDYIYALAITPDGQQIISGGGELIPNHKIKIWDMNTGHCLKTLPGHGKGIKTLAATPCARQFISSSYDGMMKIWDLGTGQCLKTFNGGGPFAFTRIGIVTIEPDHSRSLKLLSFPEPKEQLATSEQNSVQGGTKAATSSHPRLGLG